MRFSINKTTHCEHIHAANPAHKETSSRDVTFSFKGDLIFGRESLTLTGDTAETRAVADCSDPKNDGSYVDKFTGQLEVNARYEDLVKGFTDLFKSDKDKPAKK